MKLWHGSPYFFTQFSAINWAQGAGGGDIGMGIYLAENRAGGEYYAHYPAITRGSGYLYQVSLPIEEAQILDLSVVAGRESREITWNTFTHLRVMLGDDELNCFLARKGIQAIRSRHECNPTFGATILCIQPGLLRIENTWKCKRAPLSWELIDGPKAIAGANAASIVNSGLPAMPGTSRIPKLAISSAV